MAEFRYNLGDRVELKESGESGEVIGRAEYAYAESSYYVRYKAADGRQVDNWHSDSGVV